VLSRSVRTLVIVRAKRRLVGDVIALIVAEVRVS
jgi:hypothetical protein